jgi:hypothetical protein
LLKKYISRKREWFAIPVCHGETVLDQSFYHFFFAVLFPLLEYARHRTFDDSQRLYLLSCGMFNHLLKELEELIPLKILPDINVLWRIQQMGADIDFCILDSFEAYFFRANRFCVRPAVIDGDRYRDIASIAKDHLMPELEAPAPDVLIINRALGHKGHGADIRTIPNVDELTAAIEKEGLSVAVEALEGKPLAEQISLFHHARIVIAQHGASMCNLVWTQPGRSSLIEIVPPQFRQDGWHYFEILAECLGIPRLEVNQAGRFAHVEVDAITRGVRELRKYGILDSVIRSAAK